MGRLPVLAVGFGLALTALLPSAWTPAVGQTPKAGGVLTVMQREDPPQGFAIHETATISSVSRNTPPRDRFTVYATRNDDAFLNCTRMQNGTRS